MVRVIMEDQWGSVDGWDLEAEYFTNIRVSLHFVFVLPGARMESPWWKPMISLIFCKKEDKKWDLLA